MRKSRILVVMLLILSLLAAGVTSVDAASKKSSKKKRATSPYKYLITDAEKQQIVNWVNSASENQWVKDAKLTLSTYQKFHKPGAELVPFANWSSFWSTPGVSSTGVNNICKLLGIFKYPQDRHYSKAAIRLSESEKSKMVSWINSASSSDMQAAKISSSAITSINTNRPFKNFADLWTTKGLSDTNMKKIAIASGALVWVNGSTKTDTIKGIGSSYRAKLNSAPLFIFTTQSLLMNAKYDEWRGEIARTISSGSETMVKGLILRWAKLSSLMRLSGCGEQYSGLLMKVGIEKMSQLKKEDAASLRDKMIQYVAEYNAENPNAQISLVPGLSTIQKWITAAANLQDILVY
ncbi:DUF4332 domain-containing protein [Candidatus Dependentiae bacterium]|nr:DUF4332 domain-containing protein [Candidatus Dependentiae bacterium]